MAATDLLTIADAKRALRVAQSDPSEDSIITMAVTAVSELIDDLCGPVVQRTITGEVHDAPRGAQLRLRLWPVVSVTTVKVWESGIAKTLTAETLATAGTYLAEPCQRVDPDRTSARLSAVLRRRGSWCDEAWEHGSRIEVTYVAGRYANTAAVAERFRLAASEALVWTMRTWRQTTFTTPDGFVLPSGSLPNAEIPDVALGRLARDRVNLVGIA
jgi:hypothetical protein